MFVVSKLSFTLVGQEPRLPILSFNDGGRMSSDFIKGLGVGITIGLMILLLIKLIKVKRGV